MYKNKKPYDVIIVGGGIVGAMTLLACSQSGLKCLLLEKNQIATGASFGNGGMLTPSQAMPWNNKNLIFDYLKKIFLNNYLLNNHLTGVDAKTLITNLPFFLEFLRNSNSHKLLYSQTHIKSLANYSIELLCKYQKELLKQELLINNGTIKIDPNYLQHSSKNLISLLEKTPKSPHNKFITHYKNDCHGDCYLFAQKITDYLKEKKVEIIENIKVEKLLSQDKIVTGIVTNKKTFFAKNIVLCTSIDTNNLLQEFNINLSMLPVIGYAISFKVDNNFLNKYAKILSAPIIISQKHFAIILYKNNLKIIAGANFRTKDTKINKDKKAFAELLLLFEQYFPSIAMTLRDYPQNQWKGKRPVMARSLPVISSLVFDNLYVNTGHGHLGWTLSAASGKIIANYILGYKQKIDVSAFKYK